jgi:nucleoid-associated protein YgaU
VSKNAAAVDNGKRASDELATLRARTQSLEATRDQLSAEKIQLEKQLNLAASSHANSDAELEAMKRDMAALKTELGTERERSGESREKFAASESVRREFGNQLSAVQAQLKESRAAWEAAQTQAERLKDENAQLKGRLAAASPAELDTLRAQVTSAEFKMDVAQKSALALTEENSRLKAALAGAPQSAVRVVPARASSAIAAAPSRPASNVPSGVNPTVQYAATSAVTVNGNRAATAATRTHTVLSGDTLRSIATRYYGAPGRWTDIFAANRDVLKDERVLPIGRTLKIP